MAVAARRTVLDEGTARAWVAGALAACQDARERIDAVNVFPVPDADTGSNVSLTVAGGADAVTALPPGTDATALVTAFAHGAARAARGNSGIILSQWLVGFAAGLAAPRDDVPALVHALGCADEVARHAVPDPQEGTVLTVAREVATHAARGDHADVAGVLAAAVDAARSDLARLSAGHDVLRAARVVDAGACALIVVLDALVAALRGDAVDLGWLPAVDPDVVAACGPGTGGAFEVMMLVRAGWAGVEDLAAGLRAVGDAVAVVDAGDARHAHVHCDDPAAAIGLVPPGAREQVVVRRVDEPAPAERGLVVLTASPGLAAWYATCGAVTLVGPSVTAEQVARAAVDTRATRAVVVDTVGLPGEPGAYDVLRAADDGSAVVACLALVADPHVTPSAGADALGRLRAARPADADDVAPVVQRLLADVPDAQGVTVVHGDTVTADAARPVVAGLGAAHPQLEVVVAGPAVGAAWWVGVD